MYWGDDWVPTRGTQPHTATKLIVAPTIEPFSISEAKLHARIDTDADNANVTRWISAARRKVEQDTQRALLTQTWDLFVDGFPTFGYSLYLPYPPLQSVTSVNQTDTAGVETIWSATNYVVDASSTPGRIALTDSGLWPTSLRTFQPGRIRFVAGWTSAAAVPGDLAQAVALWIAWFSEHREPSAIETDAYESLIAPYVIFSAA